MQLKEHALAGADCMGEIHCGINSKGAAGIFPYRRLGSIVIACIQEILHQTNQDASAAPSTNILLCTGFKLYLIQLLCMSEALKVAEQHVCSCMVLSCVISALWTVPEAMKSHC